ncbi:hypothetical protein BC332_22096 [Capsicum chinense]|nr:hypothetical protein BC332_22096 [Capsicum chinense]
MDANTSPLFTPYKLGRFDLSHRCPNMSGIWSEEQMEAWKPVVKGVHDKGVSSFVKFGIPAACPGNGQVLEKTTPQHLKADEIPCIVNDFRIAACNAINAGFDGIEINAASGYLIDQFSIGASTEERCRLAQEIVETVIEEVGADKVGL